MKTAPRVVVLAGATSDPTLVLESQLGGATLSAAVDEVLGAASETALASWSPLDPNARERLLGAATTLSLLGEPRAATDTILRRLGLVRVSSLLARHPVGRLANSFAPTEQSRVFWRAVRCNSVAVQLLHEADVVIALDAPAVRAAWIVQSGRPEVRAYFGLAAALRELAATAL